MARALAFVALRVLELTLAVAYPLAPSVCVGVVWLLDPLHEYLRPREPFSLNDYAAALAARREST